MTNQLISILFFILLQKCFFIDISNTVINLFQFSKLIKNEKYLNYAESHHRRYKIDN